MERDNERNMYTDKDKQNSSTYDIRGKEKTLGTSEKKEKEWDGYVRIYERGKQFCTSTFECACAAQETNIS